MDVLSQLQSHPLFATFTPQALAEAVRVGTAVTYKPGEVCIRQGDAGEIFGVLISGRLEAVRGYGTEHPERLGCIGPGECFGEMSLLTGDPTGADVVAAEESRAIVFLQEAIGPMVALNAEAVRFLTRTMASRLAPARSRTAALRPAVVRYSLGASEPMRVLAVSCRREDMRYSFFDTSCEQARATGSVSGLGGGRAAHVHCSPKGARQLTISPATHEAAIAAALEALTGADGGVLGSVPQLSVIGHRVCHGGLRLDGPVVVDEEVKREIRRLGDLAPMENPYNLMGIEACQKLAPAAPQVAVFDTAFHLKMPPAAFRYALPKEFAGQAELRRFGSHGISHEGAARAACAFLKMNFDALKLIVCHLGTGASICAIDHGRSVDNTMGMTPLEGLIMATRSGDVDPGLILHLVGRQGISPEQLTEKLYTSSGLLGLSGISAHVLEVLDAAENGNGDALLAIQAYCHRARKYLSAYVGVLGGVDAIVFTGGVGQNSPGLRARICQGLEWMGIVLDETKNRSARVGAGEVAEISDERSRARVLLAGANEEHTIARQAVRAVAQQRVTDVIRHRQNPIPIGTSAHHVHLTQEHVEALFGPGRTLTWHADLTQPGQFACKEQVDLIGPKGRIERVRVLGPVRPESQVEIARTEEFKLGIDAPVRMSGDLDGTPGIALEGPVGRVQLAKGVICAMRHIHMSPQDAMEFAVRDRDVVRVRVAGERSLIFGDVMVRVSPDFRLDMHIDTDEANAAELGPGATGFLDSVQEKACL